MSAIRYCGALRIRVTYRDASNDYRCVITHKACKVYSKQTHVTIYVGAPAFLSHAVDSSEAFDEAASAALSFAADGGWPVDEECDYADSRYAIARKVQS